MVPDPITVKANLDFRVPGEEQLMLEKSDPPESCEASKQQITKILIVDDLISMRDHMIGLLRKYCPANSIWQLPSMLTRQSQLQSRKNRMR